MLSPNVTGEVCAGFAGLSAANATCTPAELTHLQGASNKGISGKECDMGNGKDRSNVGLLEHLEGRRMLSTVSLSSGVLKITGNSSSNNTLGAYASGSSIIAVHNGATKSYSSGSVSRIEFIGGSATDNIWVTEDITKPTKFWGGKGNDYLTGGSGRDTIYAGSGNDWLWGKKGDDRLYGEDGSDTVVGGDGSDVVDGGNGTDLRFDGEYVDPSSGSGGDSGGDSGSDPGAGTNTGGGSIPQDTSGETPTAVITTRGTSIQAGHAVFVHAVNSTLRDGTPLTARYEWDFGDDGSKYNKLVGFNAAHIYENPGTYTVKLTVWNESGKSDTSTVTVNVASSTRRKIYVSASGSDSNSGSQSSPIRTIARAEELLDDNSEVLFRRGDTFTTPSGLNLSGNDNVVIGAYGSGNRPVLKFTGPRGWYAVIHNRDTSVNTTIRDVKLDSHFTTGTATKDMPFGVSISGDNTTVQNVEFGNLGYAIQGNTKPDGLLAQDNSSPSSTQLRGYFSWAQGTDHVYLGNYVANVRSHVIRMESLDRVNVSYNNFTNPPEDGVTRGTLTIHKGSYAFVGYNKLQKGKATIGPLGEGDGLGDKGARWNWGVFEGNVIESPVIVEHGAQHIMLRNNVIKSTDNFGIQIEGYSSTYGRGVSDVIISNNTGYNGGKTGNFLDVLGGGVNGITLTNNLYIAPNLVTGAYATSPVKVFDSNLNDFRKIDNNVWGDPDKLYYAEGGINYVWPNWSNADGYKTPSEWNAYSVVGTDVFSNVSYDSSTMKPSSSSAAADVASWTAGVFTDITGKWRGTGSWSAGAYEV